MMHKMRPPTLNNNKLHVSLTDHKKKKIKEKNANIGLPKYDINLRNKV